MMALQAEICSIKYYIPEIKIDLCLTVLCINLSQVINVLQTVLSVLHLLTILCL